MLRKIKEKLLQNRAFSEILGVLLLIIVGLLIYNAVTPSEVKLHDIDEGYVNFKHESYEVKKDLSESDLEIICKLFDNKTLNSDRCECGTFNGDFVIVLDGDTYVLPPDGCDRVYCSEEEAFFRLNDEEWDKLEDVLNRYEFDYVKTLK